MFFNPVEKMMAMRYIRARRAEGFISVIAWFFFDWYHTWRRHFDHRHVSDEWLQSRTCGQDTWS